MLSDRNIEYGERTGKYRTFKANDFGFTDPHDNPSNSLLAVIITTVPGAGTLTDNGVAVIAGQSIPASDILTACWCCLYEPDGG